MAVLVFKAGGNTEHFPEAKVFETSPDGKTLYVMFTEDPGEGNRAKDCLAIFPEGGWLGARRDIEGKVTVTHRSNKDHR